MSRRSRQDFYAKNRANIWTGVAIATVGITAGAIAFSSTAADVAAPPVQPGSVDYTALPTTTTVAPNAPRVAPPPQVRPADGVLDTLFVGTSITAGMAASSVDFAYPNLMLRALEQGGTAKRITMPILPEPPNTARGVFSYDAAAIPGDVDLGVIELVTNDVSRSSVEDYQRKYTEFVDTFRSKNPGATLLCLGAWTVPESPPEPHEQVARDACVQAGGYYVQINDLFMDPRNRGPSTNASPFGADEFHPNNLGFMRIADAALAPLTGFFPGAPTPTPRFPS